jgi:hypothetical protein
MRRHHGMAMVMAIACVGLLTTALTVSGIMLTGESRRTNTAAEDAQLRQLLLAGEKVAQARLRSGWGLADVVILDTPKTANATIVMRLVSPGTVEIEADLPKHRVSQRVQFAQENGDWQLVTADLGN